jgi:Aspartyl protease
MSQRVPARCRVAAALTAFAIAACLVTTGRAGTAPLTVLTYQLDDRLVRVPIRLDRAILWFDVDTGAPHTVLDASTARRLRIAVVRTDHAQGAGRGTVFRQHAAPIDIAVGSIRFHVKDPWIYDLSHTGTALHEDGLLGADFFKRYVVRIDPVTKTFGVFEPLIFRYGGGGSAISLTDRADHLFIPMRLTLANGVSAKRSVRIDTGSDDAVSDDLVRESPTRRKSVQGVGLGQAYVDYSGVFSTIQIGPYSVHDVWGPSNRVPTVGMEILRRFVLTFDVQRKLLYLEPTHHLSDAVPSPAPG